MKTEHENRVLGEGRERERRKTRLGEGRERTTARNSLEKRSGCRFVLAVGEEQPFAFRVWVRKKQKNEFSGFYLFYKTGLSFDLTRFV